jgi:hypothetical protein
MTTPTIPPEELEATRRALCVTVPLDRASPLILTTLAVIAHCWKKRIPAPLQTPASSIKQHHNLAKRPAVDYKMRAAGDNEV